MFNLKLVRSHLSIQTFPEVDLPNFTIITGLNGTGKTHLLQAINQGAILADIAPNHNSNNPSQIRYFDWSTMIPQDTGYFASDTIHGERVQMHTQLVNHRNNHGWFEPARNIARQYSFEPRYIIDPAEILKMSDPELSRVLGGADLTAFRSQLERALDIFETNVLSQLDPGTRLQVVTIANALKKRVSSLTEADVLAKTAPSWGHNELFQQSFARLFVAYRDILLENTLNKLQHSEDGKTPFLSREKFIELNGEPPWDFVNESLKNSGLDFEISKPNLLNYGQFRPTLKKLSTGAEIPFTALSSGEKILMSFAFCVYYARDTRQLSVQPKLLLLDEIDAPLHPSMSKNIIDTITKTLVEKCNIKVICTTHSPSTIAMAPEEAIYKMVPDKAGLFKTSKSDALNILTVGVPTLAISYDGRRQIFVESPADAKVYDLVYKQLKTKILSERSLEFVATGAATGRGDVNTGCDVVIRLVDELSNSGNISVFGLLDWDRKHVSTKRLAVLAEGRRNGLENVLLDPLIVAFSLCRIKPDIVSDLELENTDNYIVLRHADQSKLQRLVDTVCRKIFGSEPTTKIHSEYASGLRLEVDGRCFTEDDHKYESMVLSAFPVLNSIAKNRAGELLQFVLATVLNENPFLMPREMIGVIEDLLSRPAH